MKKEGILVEFRKSGYRTAWGYRKELHVILLEEGYEYLLRTGRYTYLSTIIQKYIIKDDFLLGGKRILRKYLTEEELRLLKGFIECGSESWAMFQKALEEEWKEEELVRRIFFRVV